MLKVVLLLAMLESATLSGTLVDWPAENPANWETVAVEKLPAGVKPENPEDPDQPLSTVRIRKTDVDGDRVPDLIVDSGIGGSGGSYVFVYRSAGKGYRLVLREQGGIVVRAAERGMARIECWSRVGGGEYRRTIYRFQRGQFVHESTQGLRSRAADHKFEVISTQAKPD